MGGYRLTSDQIERIHELKAEGLYAGQIAQRMGCNENTIRKVWGVSKGGYKSKITVEVQQQIIDLRKEGSKSITEIAAEVGVSPETARRYSKMSAPRQGKYRTSDERWAEIELLRAQRLSFAEIAQRLKVTTSRIASLVRKHTGCGIDPNKRTGGVKRKVLSVVGACRICDADIPIVIDNKPDPYTFVQNWNKRFVECPECGQAYQADVLVSRAELDKAWFAQQPEDDDATSD